MPRAWWRNAQTSAAASIRLLVGVPAPCPALVSIRIRIGALPACAALPMLMLTSLGQREDHPAMRLFAAFLTKPIKASRLYNALLTVRGASADALLESVSGSRDASALAKARVAGVELAPRGRDRARGVVTVRPRTGLNVIVITAEDEHGNRSHHAQSFYAAPAYRPVDGPLRGDAGVDGGLQMWIGQGAIDSGAPRDRARPRDLAALVEAGEIDTCAPARAAVSFRPSPTISTLWPAWVRSRT